MARTMPDPELRAERALVRALRALARVHAARARSLQRREHSYPDLVRALRTQEELTRLRLQQQDARLAGLARQLAQLRKAQP